MSPLLCSRKTSSQSSPFSPLSRFLTLFLLLFFSSALTKNVSNLLNRLPSPSTSPSLDISSSSSFPYIHAYNMNMNPCTTNDGYISRPMTRGDFRRVAQLLYDSFETERLIKKDMKDNLDDNLRKNLEDIDKNDKKKNKILLSQTSKIEIKTRDINEINILYKQEQEEEEKGTMTKEETENPGSTKEGSGRSGRPESGGIFSAITGVTRLLSIMRLENDYSLRASKALRRKYAQVVYRTKEDGSIIGIAEVGIAPLPSYPSTSNKVEKEIKDLPPKRVPTLGNLAVDKEYRRQGIATHLLRQCEEIVTKRWNETQLFVAVETDSPARALYEEACGYSLFEDEDGECGVVEIPIRQGFFGEENRDHLIFYKDLLTTTTFLGEEGDGLREEMVEQKIRED